MRHGSKASAGKSASHSGARPSFAVVIPTYNRARRLARTLETVFLQEEPPAEIIVVDDCSTDETQEMLADLVIGHPELRVVRHDENQERATARNTGMALAEAEYVTFLDSDDWMYPQNLKDAGDFAASTGSKFFHNLYHAVDETGRHLRNWPTPGLRNHLRALALGNFLSCQGVFIHREIYSTYRFDTTPVLTRSEDYEFWLRVAADYPVGRIEKVNTAIVQHTGRSMLAQDTGDAERRIEYILDKVVGDPHLRDVYGPYLGRLRAGRMVFLAGIANDNKEVGAALGYLRRAFGAYPAIAAYPRFVRCFQLALMNAMGLRGR